MRKIYGLLLPLLLLGYVAGYAQEALLPKLSPENLNFIVASDMGRRGESQQRNVAALMGREAAENRIDFIAVAGDPIHDEGVQSVEDNEWKVKFEEIYTAPSLQNLPWYVVSGNHEYRGSVQAVLDYSKTSNRWTAPARYYTVEKTIGDGGEKCLLVFIDTTPLIDKYRRGKSYSDAGEQDPEVEVEWIDRVLAASDARWKIVVGHHQVYAYTGKKDEDSEREDIRARVGEILENRNIDFYVCGHIHSFQYLRPEGTGVHYVVNSSSTRPQPVEPVEGTLFCNPDPGFTVFTVSNKAVEFYFVNHTGQVVYTGTVSK